MLGPPGLIAGSHRRLSLLGLTEPAVGPPGRTRPASLQAAHSPNSAPFKAFTRRLTALDPLRCFTGNNAHAAPAAESIAA